LIRFLRAYNIKITLWREVTYLLSIELSAINVMTLNGLPQKWTQGFEKGAIEMETADGGTNHKF
jgi:hypothetical protein